MDITEYNDIEYGHLNFKRARPMMLKRFNKFKRSLTLENFPADTKGYNSVFLSKIDEWINSHVRCRYLGLDTFQQRDSIIGTTHQIDELHYLHGDNIAVFKGEYKYHRRLTNDGVKQIEHYGELKTGDVFVVSMPSCITTNGHVDFDKCLDHCLEHNIPVHIDGAWFGCCRNFELDVTHPAIVSVSVSLSKSLGLGNQRCGIRYTRETTPGPIHIMNYFGYHGAGDQWFGAQFMEKFGPDYLWNNFEHLYDKVCNDFNLIPGDAIHVAFDQNGHHIGVRTPLRFLIDNKWDPESAPMIDTVT